MSKKGVTKYNIKKHGVDICKIIFTKAKDIIGRFDIKISFYDEKYKIKVHKLFTYRSQELFINNLENKQISYHYGRKNGIKIQLRNIKEKEKPEEIVYHLVPPNDYSIFPIPLFKIEVNNENEEPKILYNSNKQHKGINIELNDDNTVEIYMNSPKCRNNNKREYDILYYWGIFVPIEYFTSNGGFVGYEKHRYFYDVLGIHTAKQELLGKDFNLIFNGYCNDIFNNKLKETTITFFENELYEEIILNTLLNPTIKDGNNEKKVQGYTNGGQDYYDNDKMLIKDTIGEKIWSNLKGKEKEEFLVRAIKSRKSLAVRVAKFNYKITSEKSELLNRTNTFFDAIILLNMYYSNEYDNNKFDANAPIEVLWMLNYPLLKAEDINILLGKYLNIDNFRIIKFLISPTNNEKSIEFNEDICIVDDIKKLAFNYCYLEYDSVYNIHILNRYINHILDEEKISFITRSNDIFVENMKYDNLTKILKEKGYTCSSMEYRMINLEQELKNRPELSKIYDMIINRINEIK